MKTSPENYSTLSVDTIGDYLATVGAVRSLLGGNKNEWSVSEIGDGNLNLVFLVQGPDESVIAKQALPYLRARGEAWPLPLSRAYFEYEALTREARRAENMTPAVLHFDPDMALTVMEFLSPHIILRKGLVQGTKYPRLANDLGIFLARTLFRGSDFSLDAEEKRTDTALFCGNHALCAVTETRVFTEPFYDAELNRWTSPQLDDAVKLIRSDEELKVAVQEMKAIFMTRAESLLHGDLHSGSVMVTEDDTRVIDPEFAFYGPMSFDVGALLGNYLIAYMAQPGQANAENDRQEYSDWILQTICATWQSFAAEFRLLWDSERKGPLFPANVFQHGNNNFVGGALDHFLQNILRESCGFAGAKMLRRVIGAAHVEDLESIADVEQRAACEKHVLTLARSMLLTRNKVANIEEIASLARETRACDPAY